MPRPLVFFCFYTSNYLHHPWFFVRSSAFFWFPVNRIVIEIVYKIAAILIFSIAYNSQLIHSCIYLKKDIFFTCNISSPVRRIQQIKNIMFTSCVCVIAVCVLRLTFFLATSWLSADPIAVTSAVRWAWTPFRPPAPYPWCVSLPQVMSVFLKLILNILEELHFNND